MKDYLQKHNECITDILTIFSNEKVPQSVIVNLCSEKDANFVSKYIAKYIQCQYRTSKGPCLKCLSCNKIEKNNHPDVIYPERTGTTLTYSVATVRKVRNDVNILPNESAHKIYIFLGAELMQNSAQNALLKLLEEPPSYAVFLLFANNLNTILETVKSRCQIFTSSLGRGVGDSVSKGKEPLSITLTNELIEILLYKTEYEALLWSSKLKNNKELFKDIILNLVFNIKNAINFKFKLFGSNDVMCCKFSKEMSEKIPVNKLLYFFEILDNINSMLSKNVNFNLIVTCFVSSLF